MHSLFYSSSLQTLVYVHTLKTYTVIPHTLTLGYMFQDPHWIPETMDSTKPNSTETWQKLPRQEIQPLQ